VVAQVGIHQDNEVARARLDAVDVGGAPRKLFAVKWCYWRRRLCSDVDENVEEALHVAQNFAVSEL
jgi:hypothetical protein